MKFLTEPIPFPGPVEFYLNDTLDDYTPAVLGPPVPMSDYRVNLLTVDRSAYGPQYVYQTLAHVLLGGVRQVDIYVGQGPCDYLTDLAAHPGICLHPPDVSGMRPTANLVYNWLRSVRGWGDHLFFEDDVSLVGGWAGLLRERVAELRSLGYSQFMLCLFAPDHRGKSRRRVTFGRKSWYTGTYSIFLTESALRAVYPHVLGEFLYWTERQDYPLLLDMAVKFALLRSGTHLFFCTLPLARHVGSVCSLTSGTTTTKVDYEGFEYQPPREGRRPFLFRSSRGLQPTSGVV